jgi:uncharacterized membrane protein YsdA (DUF1294 family)
LASQVSRLKSGSGLPQSKTLARDSTAQAFSVATELLKTLSIVFPLAGFYFAMQSHRHGTRLGR